VARDEGRDCPIVRPISLIKTDQSDESSPQRPPFLARIGRQGVRIKMRFLGQARDLVGQHAGLIALQV